MRKKINDIRIRGQDENNTLILRSPMSEVNSVLSEGIRAPEFERIQEKLQPIINKENLRELSDLSRRNFLKILVASGGVLLAGSVLNKINKFKDFSFTNQSATALSPMIIPSIPQSVTDQGLDKDFESFFNNFRLVKNKKEYILSDKNGENILIIDRDA